MPGLMDFVVSDVREVALDEPFERKVLKPVDNNAGSKRKNKKPVEKLVDNLDSGV